MEMTQARLVRGEAPHSELSGSGDGYGSGYGYGYGDGSGDGSGDGYGSGYGYGYGSGYGDGYGDGSGDGSGDGDGSKEYWLATIPGFARKWPDSQQKRLQDLQSLGATIAFWRSDKNGRACNGGTNAPVSAGTVEEIKGPLEVCTRRGLHATVLPPKHKGDRWWIVALFGEVQWSADKCAALKREVIGECL